MKAAIISLGSKSSEMLGAAMKKYFDEVDMLDLKLVEVSLGKEAAILYDGKPFSNYDCVYVKGSFRYANLLHSIATMLDKKVAYLPLPASVYTIAHNKLLTQLVLQQQNIPMPRTYVSSTADAAKSLLKKIRYPIVMKFPEGTQGKGVMFADSVSSASSLLDALGVLKQTFIIQEYIDTDGTDIRAIVLGDKVIAAMRRKAQKEEKRANIHAGGKGVYIELDPETARIAVDTARALGAELLAVDILESPLGPQIIEVNSSPGLQGISKAAAHLNVSDEIAKHFHKRTIERLEEIKKNSSKEMITEIKTEDGKVMQEFISKLQFRGEKIILPEIVNKIARMHEQAEYTMRIKKGRIEIEELKI